MDQKDGVYKNKGEVHFSPKLIRLDNFERSKSLPFGLLYFVTTKTEERGWALKVRFKGVFERLSQCNTHLFIFLEENVMGSNHIVDNLHRFISTLAVSGQLLRKAFLQISTYTSEN